MDTAIFLIQVLNGIQYGLLLFLVAMEMSLYAFREVWRVSAAATVLQLAIGVAFFFGIASESARDRIIGYETDPIPDRRNFLALTARSGTPLLQLRSGRGERMDAVAYTPWGGYALHPYAVSFMPAEVERWAAVGVSRLLTGYGLGGRGDGSEIDDLLERFAERVLRT